MTSYKDELRHYGIKGQKRGKRRFQNEDGSLTAAGRARYGVSKGDNRHGILSVSDQRAGGGPMNKGKLSNAPAQRTTGNRTAKEMGVGAARKVKDSYQSTASGVESLGGALNQDKTRYRVTSRHNDSGRLITEYAEKSGNKYRSYGSEVRNSDGSTTYTDRSTDPRDRRVLKETWKNDPLSGRYVKVSAATLGPEKHEVLKGGNSAAKRTTGNRNPKEMGVGAARKIMPDSVEAKIGAKKRYNDKGQVVVEYPRGVYNGYAQEIISNTRTHDKNGRIISNVDTPRSVLKYKTNDPRAKAVAAQRANAGVRTSARNPREMSVGAARTIKNADGSTSRRTDNGDVVFERKRKDGTTEVIRQSGRGDTRTVVGRNGATRESYKVVGEDDIRNKRTERGLQGEKHEVVKTSKGSQSAKSTGVAAVVKTSKGSQSAKSTGVAAVGKTASKQLSSVLSKARGMAAKEAVKKGAVVKKKKKG